MSTENDSSKTDPSKTDAVGADASGADAGKEKDTDSKRIKFRKTETSRLKAVVEESGKDKDKVTLPTTAKPVPKAPPGRTSVVDPMALRDTNTSKVKRVQAAKDSSPLATVSLPSEGGEHKKTETVQLKVVQQKKKELDEEMSPSSTVRLKAPGTGPSVAIPKARPAATPRDTMKISLPKLEKKESEPPGGDSATVSLKPAPTESPVPPVEAQKTAKVAAPPTVKTSTTVLEKARPKKKTQDTESTADTATADGEAKKTVSAPKSGSGRTLKIRSGAKSARTVKLKAADSDKTVAVETPEAEESKTVKLEEAPKGLKLKSRQAPLGEAPMVSEAAKARVRKTEAPGVLYTLGAAATLVAIGATTYFLVMQTIAYLL